MTSEPLPSDTQGRGEGEWHGRLARDSNEYHGRDARATSVRAHVTKRDPAAYGRQPRFVAAL